MQMLRMPRIYTALSIAFVPVILIILGAFGPFLTNPLYLYSGLGIGVGSALLPGLPTIDPNVGTTSLSLGARAAFDVLSGRLPLWNHFEGLGAPLLGEMQSAALFPPTWLLALPHGQVIEHALLQALAGTGTYLFLRAFGLRRGAALAAALLFEVNGVFAWLRNAAFNPVAFLPWLFLTIESLRAAAITEAPLSGRLPPVCLGAAMAALALYAGFPEQVYLYSILLIGWVVFRSASMDAWRIRRFVLDLLLTALLAVALSAPLLLSFAELLTEAALSGHSEHGFYGVWLPSAALLHYVMPYAYGPIFDSPVTVIRSVWSATGGYIGFMPVVLAFAGVFLADRRPTKVLLAAWIVVAIGVSHGLPGVYQAFMALPLTRIAATFRYLNPSWIFCFAVLAGLFLDRVPDLPRPVLRRVMAWAVAAALLSVALAAVPAFPTLADLWTSATDVQAGFLIGAFVAVVLLSGATLWASRRAETGRTALLLSVLLVGEAAAWFLVPYLSYPRTGTLDADAVAFLKSNIGFQRVAETAGHRLGPNYGTLFGIATLHYDDLPTPQRTADHIRNHLDPYANPTVFQPWFPPLEPEQRADREKLFRERLPRYAQAGVKYVLGGLGIGVETAVRLEPQGHTPHAVAAGEWVEMTGRLPFGRTMTVSEVSLLVATYGNTANGWAKVTLCAHGDCADGVSNIGQAQDNSLLTVGLARPVRIAADQDYTVRFEKLDGERPLALWIRPKADATPFSAAGSGGPLKDGYAPEVRFTTHTGLTPVHRSPTMVVYEIPGVRDYVSAEGCTLTPATRDRVDAVCMRPSTLVRLEVHMRGWRATVNGKPVPIGLSDDTFQTIELPAGAAQVEFTYAPTGMNAALAMAGIALLLILAVLARSIGARLATAIRGRPERPTAPGGALR